MENERDPKRMRTERVSDQVRFEEMLNVLEEGFEDPEHFGKTLRPSKEYVREILSDPSFLALVARDERGDAVGALTGYVLRKYAREETEIYIYDLAVRPRSRRCGAATSLLEELRRIAKERGASLLFVQADLDEDDLPAHSLYRKFGRERTINHYEIPL